MTFFIHLIPGRVVKELYVLVIPLIVLVYRQGFSGNNQWLFRTFTSMIFPPGFDVVFLEPLYTDVTRGKPQNFLGL